LASQLRRAAIAVPASIAEGQARYSAGEFHHLLGRARGSVVEIETELLIAQTLGYLAAEQAQPLLDKAAELGKILNGLAASVHPAA
jgi:four helix bundle protein